MSTLRFWRKFDSLRARTSLRMLRVTVLISQYRVKMVVNLSVPYDCFELQAPDHWVASWGGAGGVPDHDSQRKKTPFHISRGK